MNKTDSVDKELVRLIGQNARQNSAALAKKLNLSAATVRRRLRKLIENNSLRIVGVVDPAEFGFPVVALISLNVAHNKIISTVDELSKRPEVTFVSTITGRYDVVAMARFPSANYLSEFVIKELSRLEGIRDSETFICLEIKKRSLVPLP